MCGISGAVWRNSESAFEHHDIDRMTRVLRHRGPDGQGIFRRTYENGQGVALGHRRLSIVDAVGGYQPMCNEEENIWITFNGEIYNYIELRSYLTKRGHIFKTKCDTESIIHLYEEIGFDCVNYLRGMFAFAIWDERNNILFMARDRLGQKPLFYHYSVGRLVFASEIKSLLLAPQVVRRIDADSVNQYFTFGYIPHPRTIFRDIQKLPPGHYAVYKNGYLTTKNYWEPQWDFESHMSVDAIQEHIRAELTEAIKLRTRTDISMGAFLSGGIDSTTVAGVMQQMTPTPVQTFVMGSTTPEYDETNYAKAAANHLGTQHVEFEFAPINPQSVDTVLSIFDEPFGDSSAIPTYYLASAVQKQVKVALTGDGGDELFGGYMRYHTIDRTALLDHLPDLAKRILFGRTAKNYTACSGRRSVKDRVLTRRAILAKPPNERYSEWMAIFNLPARMALFTKDFQSQITLTPEDSLHSLMNTSTRSLGTRASQCDLRTYLPGDLLVKTDTTSMAHSLECRSPFLDHRVVECALAIPFGYHRDYRLTKPILSRAFTKQIPDSIKRRKKMGFSVPLDGWLRGPLRSMLHENLLDPNRETRCIFEALTIQKLVDQHLSGKWNHGARLWTLLCFEHWHRQFITKTS